jgi:hypothetical protein
MGKAREKKGKKMPENVREALKRCMTANCRTIGILQTLLVAL